MFTSRSNGGTPVTSRPCSSMRPSGLLEAGDHAQGRGLARAGRSEHREELAVRDVEVDARDRLHLAIALDEAFEPNGDRPGRYDQAPLEAATAGMGVIDSMATCSSRLLGTAPRRWARLLGRHPRIGALCRCYATVSSRFPQRTAG